MAVQIQIRRDTTQNWYEINPILAKGEMGIEYLDNGKTKIKIGNGVDTYSNLEYFADTINYYDIINKPQINNIELNGNVSLIDLGIQPIGNYASYEDVVNGLALKADIDNTYSKSDIDTFFNNLLKIPAIEDQEGKYLKVLQGEIVWSDITGDIVSVDKLNEELDKKVDKIDGYSLISISELERLASVSNYDDQPIKEDLELLKEEVDTKASINSLDNYVLKNDLTDTLDEYALKSDISSKAEASDLISHISNTLNPHKVTKEQIGLGNVNNTSDINKPISIAMQTALNEKQDNLTTGYGISIENNVITNTVPNVQSDWLAEEGNAVIINKPNLATVATSGSYNDLEDKPVIPSEYVLPIASSSQLGGIKVGSGLNISETDGTLSVKTAIINYNDLEHKPSIGGITLIEGQTAEDLDLATSKATQSALNLKADKADTLAGYGITDAYTKEEVEARLSSVYKFKGSVPTIDYLPLENNVIGDVYNVEDTGANYAWDGDKWDKLSETIDLTPYALKSTSLAGYGITDAYTKEEVDVKIAEKDSLPAQADKQGTFLSTNGTSAFWSTLPESNDTTKGIVKLASVEELNEGLSESSVITVKNLSDKLLSKQNVLTAGEGISIVDDTISATINVPDNVVLSDNYVNAKLWKGTLSEYNSLPEYSDDITYIVTDDYNIAPSGTTNYEELENKPQINSIELSGNKTLEELGIQASGDYATNEYVNTELDKKLNTNQITNCITKIPQDIKIETSDTVLTLKSGSKPYKADSSFVTVSSDVTLDIASVATEYLLVYGEDNTIKAVPPSLSFSQDTEPSNSSYLWFNTTTKEVKFKADSGDITVCSLPIAIIYSDKTVETFNGFGYIGNTLIKNGGNEYIFANGRNIDGSLNNIKKILPDLTTWLIGIADNISYTLFVRDVADNRQMEFFETSRVYKQDSQPTPIAYAIWYSPRENKWRYILADTSNGWLDDWIVCEVVKFSGNTGHITSFSPKNVFQAVDRNDSEWASIAGKPSSRYIALTLEANGAQYTAPANGWIQLIKTPTGAGQYLVANSLDIPNTGTDTNNIAFKWSTVNGHNNGIFFPVRKGQQFTIGYTFGGATISFKFIYDEGAK